MRRKHPVFADLAKLRRFGVVKIRDSSETVTRWFEHCGRREASSVDARFLSFYCLVVIDCGIGIASDPSRPHEILIRRTLRRFSPLVMFEQNSLQEPHAFISHAWTM